MNKDKDKWRIKIKKNLKIEKISEIKNKENFKMKIFKNWRKR